MDATIIIAIVPVVLLVAYIIWLIRAKVTEGRDIDLREPVTALVICLVAVLIIGAMTSSTVTYTYSEETNTLYINQNLIDRNQPFDSYGDEVKSVVIGNNCRLIETGTLDSLTNLEYVEIGENVEVREGAFADIFRSPTGASIEPAAGQEYVGFGTGVIYSFDGSVFTYDATGTAITGSSETLEAVMVPETYNGHNIIRISNQAFSGATGIVGLASSGDLKFIETDSFSGCTGLLAVKAPNMQGLSNRAFSGCTSLAEANFPNLRSCGAQAFENCTSLTVVDVPSLNIVYQYAFRGATAIEKVTLGPMGTISGSVFPSWTFYASDGTTVLEQTTDNLAGKTFQGTASALIEVSPGLRSLSPEQIQMVHLHDAELQDLKDHLTIDPLPFQPAVQTQDQEPVSA